MCLDIVLSTEVKEVSGEGYKVFSKLVNNKLYSPVVLYCFKPGWNISNSYTLGRGSYTSGFHFFFTEKDAIVYKEHLSGDAVFNNLIIKKIKYDEIIAQGKNCINSLENIFVDTIVARKIWVDE